jgi:hypothetical protein
VRRFLPESSGGNVLHFHNGRELVYVQGNSSPKLDTFVASFQTGRHLLRHRRRYGHAFWFNNANLPGILMTLLARIPTSVNTDGMEWRRANWGWHFKVYYFLAALLISRLCKSLISDSRGSNRITGRSFARRPRLSLTVTPEHWRSLPRGNQPS